MRDITALRSHDGQWIASFADCAYPNVKRPTKEEAVSALKARDEALRAAHA
jgi:hypothetical protein